MKQKIEELLQQAVNTLKNQGDLAQDFAPQIAIERTRDAQHGDFASNLAMMLAKSAKTNPRQLAEKIIADALPVRFQIQQHKIIWPPEQRGV